MIGAKENSKNLKPKLKILFRNFYLQLRFVIKEYGDRGLNTSLGYNINLYKSVLTGSCFVQARQGSVQRLRVCDRHGVQDLI